MAIGTYGTIIPISLGENINSLVDISYCYHEKRTFDSLSYANFMALPSSILTQSEDENGKEVEGMYNLQLPLSKFNKKGFYTVYIKPKEIKAKITDVGTLTAFPNVRGLVLDVNDIDDSSIQDLARTSNMLVGYRVVFLNNGKREPYYRIVTSNNTCEPVVQAPNSSSDKSYSYRYADASNLSFVTLSPSSAPTFKDNSLPYMGAPTQDILLVNTIFEPIQLDIEFVDHDADTISYMLENSQLRDLDNGVVTTYDDNDAVYHQSEHYTLKDEYNGKPVYEVKKNKKQNIDFSQTISDK